MVKKKANLSEYNTQSMPLAKEMKFGIVVADWNSEITNELYLGAIQTLMTHGAEKENILKKEVPGSFELTLGARFMAEYSEVDAVIVLGCVVRGETAHFDYICQSVSHGITELNLTYNIPFIFGVLTTENMQQAEERAGGKHGNKGVEAALTAIKMVNLQKEMKGIG